MRVTRGRTIALLAVAALALGCRGGGDAPGDQQLPNPASVHCEEQGGQLEIREAPDGGQIGVCVFPDGSECEEWAYFRGECEPAGSP